MKHERQRISFFPAIRSNRQEGFTLLQMIIAVALIGTFTAFAIVGISKARVRVELQNSVRLLANNIERARIDAVRRHSDPVNSPTTATKVWFTGLNTYNVTMDFTGSGTPTTRTFTFDQDVPGLALGSPLPSISFNWRGRTSSCTTTFAIFTDEGQSWVDVSDAGEVTVDSDVDVLPSVTYATANQTIDVSSGTIVNGSGAHNNSVDCGNDGATAGPPASGGGSGGCPGWTVNPSSQSIIKNGGSTGTITFAVTSGGSSVVTASAPVNLRVTPATASLSSGSSATFTVTSLNKTRGTFPVTFNLPCSSPQVLVKVTN